MAPEMGLGKCLSPDGTMGLSDAKNHIKKPWQGQEGSAQEGEAFLMLVAEVQHTQQCVSKSKAHAAGQPALPA